MESKIAPIFSNLKTRQVVLATLTVAIVGLAFWLLYRYRIAILILFTAIILGMALQPLVDWLVKRGLSKTLSLAILYVILLSFLGLGILLLVPSIVTQSSALIITIPEIYVDLRAALMKSNSNILMNIAWNMPSDIRLLLDTSSQTPAEMVNVQNVLNIAGTIMNTLLAAIALFLLTSFWILDGERTITSLLLYLPQRYRPQTREVVEQIESRVGAFVRGQFLLSLSIAVLALISYLIIGLPNALVLALIAGIFEAVPIFGPALGAVPALLVAFSVDPTLVIWVLISTVVMQALENYLLVPRIMGASVGVNPIITLLLLATLSSLLGLPGALLAIPSAAIFQLLLSRFVLDPRQKIWHKQEGRDATSALRYETKELILDIRKHLRRKKVRADMQADQLEDEIEDIAVQVQKLLDKKLEGIDP